MTTRQRPAAEPGRADVEAPVDQDLELETGPGGALQQAHSAFGAVAALDQPDARHLLQPADPGEQLRPGPLPSPEDRHERSASRRVTR
jgi:hypothetical protein